MLHKFGCINAYVHVYLKFSQHVKCDMLECKSIIIAHDNSKTFIIL